METKFISRDGYKKIEHVSGKKAKAGQIGFCKKTVRFVKRLFAQINSDINAAKSRKQHAHSEPKRNFIKKKAVITAMACTVAIILSCATVASALDFSAPAKAAQAETEPQAISEPAPLLLAESAPENYNEVSSNYIENPDIFMELGYSALTVDGELIGVTNQGSELEELLENYLAQARKDYDETTTTEFANSVEVTPATASSAQTLSAEELFAAAEGKLSVSLFTDWSYEVDMEYETNVTYDETKDNSYTEVTKEGENGKIVVNLKLNYVDGNLVDSVVTDTKVTKEPVAEEVTKGSKQGEQEYSLSGEASGSSTGGFIWPFPHTHNITSLMEWRWGRMHNGIDIAGGDDYGQPIIAADSGVVTFSGNDGGGYGNYVMIDHGNGYMTVYGHASELACSTGQYVNQGDTIAYAGSTGNSTGPHLHFEIRLNGEYQDPLNYVS